MNEEFAVVRSQMQRLPSLLDDARRNVSVYIDNPNDFNSMISTALSIELQTLRIPITSDRSTATTICRVSITEGRGQQESLTYYNPSLQAVFSSDTGALFTFSTRGERAVALRPEVAKQRAYQSLANAVRGSFAMSIME
jgi:hypothetical protein